MTGAANAFVEKITAEYGVNCGEGAMCDGMFHPELRDACVANVCGNYGKCHTCPPLNGEAQACIAKVKSYPRFIAFQKIYYLEDAYDWEGMVQGQQDFCRVIQGVAKAAKEAFAAPFILGAGGCTLCKPCAAQEGLPCRHPDLAVSSLEAHCIQVSELAGLCGMKYINGENTVTYFGAVFLPAEDCASE